MAFASYRAGALFQRVHAPGSLVSRSLFGDCVRVTAVTRCLRPGMIPLDLCNIPS